MSAYVVWAVLAGAAMVVEMMTGTFYLLVLALAAIGAALGSYIGGSVSVQLAIFAVLAMAGFLVLRKFRKPSPEVLSQDVGSRVTVLSVNADGTYRVRYRGTEWDAQLQEGVATVGEQLTVRGVQGIRLQCVRG